MICALCREISDRMFRGYVGRGEANVSGTADDAVCPACVREAVGIADVSPVSAAWMVAHARHFYGGVSDPSCPICQREVMA